MDNILGEIDMERTRYLQSADKLLEEMLEEKTTVERPNKAETVCCGVLIDIEQAARTPDLYSVCGNSCISSIKKLGIDIGAFILNRKGLRDDI